jgi:hypothetical protein
MTREQGRRQAAVLLILAVALWFHAWFPALIVAAFVVRVLLHKRLEGDLGHNLLPLWRRVWPPAPLVLVPHDGALDVRPADVEKVLPLTLNLLALSMIVLERPQPRSGSGLGEHDR